MAPSVMLEAAEALSSEELSSEEDFLIASSGFDGRSSLSAAAVAGDDNDDEAAAALMSAAAAVVGVAISVGAFACGSLIIYYNVCYSCLRTFYAVDCFVLHGCTERSEMAADLSRCKHRWE